MRGALRPAQKSGIDSLNFLKRNPFTAFLLFAVVYHLLAILHGWFVFDRLFILVNEIAFSAKLFKNLFSFSYLLFFALILFLIYFRKSISIPEGFAAVLAISVLTPAFAVFKSSMPIFWPFYADPFFAELDRLLHFGNDAYQLFVLTNFLPSGNILELFYGPIWLLVLFVAPALIGFFDASAPRKWRFVGMTLISWVVLGNVVAFLGLSAGPAFYDRIYGTERFADFFTFFNAAGLNDTLVEESQAWLWDMHIQGKSWIGTGISAFPSVHVATSCAIALYCWDVNRLLGIVGLIYLSIILMLSVLTGYHYAVDGYFSILVIWIFWRWHRNHQFKNS